MYVHDNEWNFSEKNIFYYTALFKILMIHFSVTYSIDYYFSKFI